MRMYFKKRIPEPKIMEQKEMEAFEQTSKTLEKAWHVPIALDIKNILHDKSSSIKILDVGCGPGLLSKTLAIFFPKSHITAMDISKIALRLAKKNLEKKNNIDFVLANVNALPFKSASFDVIVCKDSFHHFEFPERALKEMVRVLKKDGTLYIQDLRRDMPMYLLRMCIPPNTTLKKLQFYSARASYTKSEIKNFLKKLPLKKIRVATKVLTKGQKNKFQRAGLHPLPLKISFQSRYVACATKNA